MEQFEAKFKYKKIKQCLHPEKEKCSGKIIRAHSIQNNGIIRELSENGLICMPRRKSSNPFSSITTWGKGEATTFYGFCSFHDKVTFSEIEDFEFKKTKKQIFLFTYRALCYFLHKKTEELSSLQDRVTHDSIDVVLDYCKSTKSLIKDFEYIKNRMDNSILTQNYNNISSIVWEFHKPIKFASIGVETPDYDYEGKMIQNLTNTNDVLGQIIFSVFSQGQNSFCIFSWLSKYDSRFRNYTDWIRNISEKDKENFLNYYIPANSDLIVLPLSKWDSFSEYARQEFTQLTEGMDLIMNVMTEHKYVDWLKKRTFSLFD